MATSISKQYTYSPVQEQIENRRILTDVLADLTKLHSAVTTLTAKMDADFADVTNASVDYAASVDPVALDLTA